jgi:hypothetical protein
MEIFTLKDVNLAVSPSYALPDSPKGVTVKCRDRRAKMFSMFARYTEALSDHKEFEKLRVARGTVEDKNMKKDIDEGMRAVRRS